MENNDNEYSAQRWFASTICNSIDVRNIRQRVTLMTNTAKPEET